MPAPASIEEELTVSSPTTIVSLPLPLFTELYLRESLRSAVKFPVIVEASRLFTKSVLAGGISLSFVAISRSATPFTVIALF